MNSEKQRIAIAEYCGWKDVRGHMGIPPEGGMLFPYPEHHEEDWRLNPFRGLPDYPNDLNAMHEAEKTLTQEQWDEYEIDLGEVVWKDDMSFINTRKRTGATAAQRAEAFLRTIGKWEE